MIPSALLFGLLGSLHCIGMCGPIAFMLPVDRIHRGKMAFQVGLYHIGRLLSYGIIGLLFGFLGKGLYLFGLQQKLSIVVGAVMILIVLWPRKQMVLPGTRPVFRLISTLKSALGKQLRKRTPDTFLTLGLLNGLLPCGLVYMALLGAMATGSPAMGALYMLVFGLGTVPLMSAAVAVGKLAKQPFQRSFRKFVPYLVAAIGVLFILRGMGLGIPYISPKEPATVSAEMDCHP